MPDIKEEKKAIRKEVIARRRKLTPSVIEKIDKERSYNIIKFIKDIGPQIPKPLNIMSYSSYGGEYPTVVLNQDITKSKNRLVLPYTTPYFDVIPYYVDDMLDLIRSPLGMDVPDPHSAKPAHLDVLDVILVPGVAFDRQGVRIGYGRGCYDTFIDKVNANRNVPVIGLAYSFQIFDHLPRQPHDKLMDYIITEDEIIKCR